MKTQGLAGAGGVVGSFFLFWIFIFLSMDMSLSKLRETAKDREP